MSDEEKAPKKAARKRVVKKGVRGTRAPRKKTVVKNDEEPEIVGEEIGEDDFSDDNETTFALADSEPTESAPAIEVVEEDVEEVEREKPRKSDSKKGNSKKREERQRDDRKKDDRPSAESDDDRSDDEGEERSEGRNRRGRNRRGGQGRDREDSGPKRAAVDKDEAAAKAWEIYQGELEEEGVSLVDPRRARDVARRCLELATIFCEERDRYLDK